MAERFIIRTLVTDVPPEVHARSAKPFSDFKDCFCFHSSLNMQRQYHQLCAVDELGWGLGCRELHREIGTHLTPAGMSAKVSKPVSKTKKPIVLAQSDTVVFNNTHTEEEFSVNCFEAIILIKRCRDQKGWRQSSVLARGQTSCGSALCPHHSADELWCCPSMGHSELYSRLQSLIDKTWQSCVISA